nr:hypothetical protein [Mesomycoplasma ovipneumoniae]
MFKFSVFCLFLFSSFAKKLIAQALIKVTIADPKIAIVIPTNEFVDFSTWIYWAIIEPGETGATAPTLKICKIEFPKIPPAISDKIKTVLK